MNITNVSWETAQETQRQIHDARVFFAGIRQKQTCIDRLSKKEVVKNQAEGQGMVKWAWCQEIQKGNGMLTREHIQKSNCRVWPEKKKRKTLEKD